MKKNGVKKIFENNNKDFIMSQKLEKLRRQIRETEEQIRRQREIEQTQRQIREIETTLRGVTGGRRGRKKQQPSESDEEKRERLQRIMNEIGEIEGILAGIKGRSPVARRPPPPTAEERAAAEQRAQRVQQQGRSPVARRRAPLTRRPLPPLPTAEERAAAAGRRAQRFQQRQRQNGDEEIAGHEYMKYVKKPLNRVVLEILEAKKEIGGVNWHEFLDYYRNTPDLGMQIFIDCYMFNVIYNMDIGSEEHKRFTPIQGPFRQWNQQDKNDFINYLRRVGLWSILPESGHSGIIGLGLFLQMSINYFINNAFDDENQRNAFRDQIRDTVQRMEIRYVTINDFLRMIEPPAGAENRANFVTLENWENVVETCVNNLVGDLPLGSSSESEEVSGSERFSGSEEEPESDEEEPEIVPESVGSVGGL